MEEDKTFNPQIRTAFPFRRYADVNPKAGVSFFMELKMDETMKAYLAGLFDGEGSIFICNATKKYKGRTYRHLVPYVAIAMTSKETISFVQTCLPLWQYYVVERGQWQTQYMLRTSKRENITTILSILLPYLIAKKRQAEIMLSFCKIKHDKTMLVQDEMTMIALKNLNKPNG